MLSNQRIAKAFSLTDSQAHEIVSALYYAGFIRASSRIRAMDDPVLRDIVDGLTMREILAKSEHDVEEHFLEALAPRREQVLHFDVTLPMARSGAHCRPEP